MRTGYRYQRMCNSALFRVALLGAVLFTAPSVVAEDDACGPVDMRQPGGSMENISVLDQDGTGLCYAYVATQMIDAYRFSKLPKPLPADIKSWQSSPVATAFELASGKFYYRNITNPFKGGGIICDAVNYSRKKGTCTQQALKENSDSGYAYPVTSYWELSLYLDFYERFHRLSSETRELENRDTENPFIHAADIAKRRKILEELTAPICRNFKAQGLLPEGLSSSLDALEEFLDKNNSMEFLLKTGLAACSKPENREFFDIPACTERAVFSKKNALKSVHQWLNSKDPQPMGIGICSQLFHQGRKYRGRWGAALSDMFGGTNCGGHGVLIIGRRKLQRADGKSTCQFLIRNSWGTSCYNYSGDWSCEAGNIWVDADKVAGSMLTRSVIGDAP